MDAVSRANHLLEAGEDPHDKGAQPFSTSKTSNWVARAGGLPHYIQHVAQALVKKGKDRSEAIGMAVGIVKNWASGKAKVHPAIRAAAQKAIAAWEAKRAGAHVTEAAWTEADVAGVLEIFEAHLARLDTVWSGLNAPGARSGALQAARDLMEANVGEPVRIQIGGPFADPGEARRARAAITAERQEISQLMEALGGTPTAPEKDPAEKAQDRIAKVAGRGPRDLRPTKPHSGGDHLAPGATGELVHHAQGRLKELGYDVEQDGVYGDETEDAVRSFQDDHKLAVDGEIGRETKMAMRGTTPTEVAERRGERKGSGTDKASPAADREAAEVDGEDAPPRPGTEASKKLDTDPDQDGDDDSTPEGDTDDDAPAAKKVTTKTTTTRKTTSTAKDPDGDGDDDTSPETDTDADSGSAEWLSKGDGVGGKPHDGVKHRQEQLIAAGTYVGDAGADGKFGPETEKGVKRLQRRWGLKPNGIIDGPTGKLLDDQGQRKDVEEAWGEGPGKRYADANSPLIKKAEAATGHKEAKPKGRTGKPISAAEFDAKHPRVHIGRTGGGQFVSVGDTGGEVRKVQEAVGAKVDGQYGDETRKKVRHYQEVHGLQVDGKVGAQTAAAMAGEKAAKPGPLAAKGGGTAAPSPSKASSSSTKGSQSSTKGSKSASTSTSSSSTGKSANSGSTPETFTTGAQGPEVSKLQQLLGLKPSGTLDKTTFKRIEQYQENHGLQVDGIIGSQTLASLLGKPAAPVGAITPELATALSNYSPTTGKSRPKPGTQQQSTSEAGGTKAASSATAGTPKPAPRPGKAPPIAAPVIPSGNRKLQITQAADVRLLVEAGWLTSNEATVDSILDRAEMLEEAAGMIRAGAEFLGRDGTAVRLKPGGKWQRRDRRGKWVDMPGMPDLHGLTPTNAQAKVSTALGMASPGTSRENRLYGPISTPDLQQMVRNTPKGEQRDAMQRELDHPDRKPGMASPGFLNRDRRSGLQKGLDHSRTTVAAFDKREAGKSRNADWLSGVKVPTLADTETPEGRRRAGMSSPALGGDPVTALEQRAGKWKPGEDTTGLEHDLDDVAHDLYMDGAQEDDPRLRRLDAIVARLNGVPIESLRDTNPELLPSTSAARGQWLDAHEADLQGDAADGGMYSPGLDPQQYVPRGRTDEESYDYTDDPGELLARFGRQKLQAALDSGDTTLKFDYEEYVPPEAIKAALSGKWKPPRGMYSPGFSTAQNLQRTAFLARDLGDGQAVTLPRGAKVEPAAKGFRVTSDGKTATLPINPMAAVTLGDALDRPLPSEAHNLKAAWTAFTNPSAKTKDRRAAAQTLASMAAVRATTMENAMGMASPALTAPKGFTPNDQGISGGDLPIGGTYALKDGSTFVKHKQNGNFVIAKPVDENGNVVPGDIGKIFHLHQPAYIGPTSPDYADGSGAESSATLKADKEISDHASADDALFSKLQASVAAAKKGSLPSQKKKAADAAKPKKGPMPKVPTAKIPATDATALTDHQKAANAAEMNGGPVTINHDGPISNVSVGGSISSLKQGDTLQLPEGVKVVKTADSYIVNKDGGELQLQPSLDGATNAAVEMASPPAPEAHPTVQKTADQLGDGWTPEGVDDALGQLADQGIELDPAVEQPETLAAVIKAANIAAPEQITPATPKAAPELKPVVAPEQIDTTEPDLGVELPPHAVALPGGGIKMGGREYHDLKSDDLIASADDVGSLDGKSVVVTGKLDGETRSSITKKLEAAGATVLSGVEKNPDYLIVGQKAGSKLKKARQAQIPIIPDAELKELVEALLEDGLEEAELTALLSGTPALDLTDYPDE